MIILYDKFCNKSNLKIACVIVSHCDLNITMSFISSVQLHDNDMNMMMHDIIHFPLSSGEVVGVKSLTTSVDID